MLRDLDIKTAPSDPKFLFRAHRYVGMSQPTFQPELEVPFDFESRRTISVDKFAAHLAKHLGKTQEQKRTGDKIQTYFLSMSSVLEWTIHTTGQKWRESAAEEIAGLGIFDVRRLRQTSDSTIFRVSDILQFLKGRGKEEFIPRGIQRWAQNCDEYVLMGNV